VRRDDRRARSALSSKAGSGHAETPTLMMAHWLLLVGFISGHLLAYFAVLRHLRVFTAERTILAYHVVAFAIVLVLVLVAFANGTIGFAALCGLLALQFVYSISFLELWSLAQGSYSLQILSRVSRKGSVSREEILATCEKIGAGKKRHRLDNLLTYKLAARSADGRLELSMLGAMLVRSLGAIMRLSTIRSAS
jgi:hypothetical protein